MNILLQGWLLGLAYVAPIGMQNMYVINTSLEKSRIRALQVALIVIVFDVSLALACFFGVGLVLEKFIILESLILGVGSLVVIYIGYSLITHKSNSTVKTDVNQSIPKIIFVCFALTWLNPQALIDGTLLLGSFRATLSAYDAVFFIIGVGLASAMWFLGISMLVSTYKDIFNARLLKIINIICGVILIGFGFKLIIEFSLKYL